MNGSCARSVGPVAAATAAVACLWTSAASAQSIHDVSVVLTRVAERLEQYYKRVQSIVCIEKMTTQSVGNDMTPIGFARTIESELRVESDAADDGARPAEPKVLREIRKINGRTPRPREKEGCYDPNPLSTEPLAFLLPANREEYTFTWAGFGKGREQNLMLIDYRSRETGKPSVKEHERGREDCLSFSIPGGTKGRVWIDTATHDVVRVEEKLIGPIDIRFPLALQRRHSLPDAVVLARFDRYVKYRSVTFDNPLESMLLPESIDELTILTGGGSHRTSQRYSDYKRFLTAGRVVK